MIEIFFITSNSEKIRVANIAAAEFPEIRIVPHKMNCPEIQSDNADQIATTSAEYAANMLKKAVVKSDTGLYITALNDFPGPYSSYVEKRLSPSDILSLLRGKERKAYYKEVVAYCEPGKKPLISSACTHGKIAKRASGRHGYGFDRIFIADGDAKTMAHYDDLKRAAKYNTPWKQLLQRVLSQ